MNYVDCIGLSNGVIDGEEYAKLQGLDGEYITDEQTRLQVLANLSASTGVTVFTGPRGRDYWSRASREVSVAVRPDNYVYTDRFGPREWSLRANGGDSTTVRRLLKSSDPVERGRKGYDLDVAARELVAAYDKLTPEPITEGALSVTVLRTQAAQLRFAAQVRDSSGVYALDWEWDPETNLPLGLAVSSAHENWYLPVEGNDGEYLRGMFSDILERGKGRYVFHNGKSDIGTQYHADPLALHGRLIDDTIVMAYLVGEPVLGLKELTEKLLQRKVIEYPPDLKDLPLAQQARYAASDTRNTYDLYEVLSARMDAATRRAYERNERPLVPVLAHMELYGSPVSVRALVSLHNAYEDLEQGLRSMCWQRWRRDVSKDKEARAVLREKLGYDPGTLDKRVLSLIEADWMDLFLGYRKIRTLRRNYLAKYIKQWEAEGQPPSFKLFSRFNQAGDSDKLSGRSFRSAPRTGRLSSAAPNLMQVSGPLRPAFVAPEGCLYWYFDYSQLELRVAASVSGDPVMRDAINNGDIHEAMQDAVYKALGVRISRPIAKRSNFNLRYGGSGDMLVGVLAEERVFLPTEMAERIVEVDKQTYAGYWQWYDRCVSEAVVNGYGETLWGRRVYYPDLRNGDAYLRSHAERAVANLAVQGTAADIVKDAMVRSAPVLRHFGAHLAIQVHDSLSGWVPKENAQQFFDAMKIVLETYQLDGVKLEVDGGLGQSWAEASS